MEKIVCLLMLLCCAGMLAACSSPDTPDRTEFAVKTLSPETEDAIFPAVEEPAGTAEFSGEQGLVYEEHDPISGTHRALEFEAIAVSAPIAFDYSRESVLTVISSYEELRSYWNLHGIAIDGKSVEAYYYDRWHDKDCSEEWKTIAQYDEAYFAEHDLMIAAVYFGAVTDEVWAAEVCADEKTQGIVIHIEHGGGVAEAIDEWHMVVELADGKFADFSGMPTATVRWNKT